MSFFASSSGESGGATRPLSVGSGEGARGSTVLGFMGVGSESMPGPELPPPLLVRPGRRGERSRDGEGRDDPRAAFCSGTKVAPQVRAPFMTVSPLALQSPVKPLNAKFRSAKAERDTSVPSAYCTVHAASREPHRMPPGPTIMPLAGLTIVNAHVAPSASFGSGVKVATQVIGRVMCTRPLFVQSPLNPAKT